MQGTRYGGSGPRCGAPLGWMRRIVVVTASATMRPYPRNRRRLR